MAQRHRVKISATLDPELLDSVDAYLRDHPDRDRDTVIDEALGIWLDLAREQDHAMEEQYMAPDDRPKQEVEHWHAIREASARMLFNRDRE